MTDIGLAAVEQRMTILEAELRRTQARVRDLEEGRRWMARQCVLIMSGVAVLILVFGFAVPTRGAGPATVTAPFTVVGASGDKLVSIEDPGVISVFNRSGKAVLQMGLNTAGGGTFTLGGSPGFTSSILMSIGSQGPLLQLAEAGLAIALLSVDAGGNPEFEMHGGHDGKSVPVQLGETPSGNGHLVLADKNSISRVEAGTLQNGDGAVRVYGPTGACTLAIAGIPCMIESK